MSRFVKHVTDAFATRSHNCALLSKSQCGQNVKLTGWVKATRFDNKIVILRDSYGETQCILDKQLTKSIRLNNETVVEVSGVVKERSTKQVAPDSPSDHVEIHVDKMHVLNKANPKLPILPCNKTSTNLETRLKFRYLDLRSKGMQNALRFRSNLSNVLRKKLLEFSFIECETPTLLNRTPGGANEFIVPTQEVNKYFSLVQSPQQLKQLLMVGGLDRYFQFARCYRDESTRSDRQPEFTQLDIELAFTDMHNILALVNNLMKHVGEFMATDCFNNIPILSYDDAIKLYGTDKPDLRFDNAIIDEDNCITMKFANAIDKFTVQELYKELDKRCLSSDQVKVNIAKGETLLRIQSNDNQSRLILGASRNILAEKLAASGVNIYKRVFSPVWIVDFPLFDVELDGRLTTNHHPFTAPTLDTFHLLTEDPLMVKGQHYDLVINGQEIAGGSIRIHNSQLQRQIFDVLKIDSSKFEYFLDALNSGCPPHGGIAFGFDRLCACLLCKNSIREVIAFPKLREGHDLMIGCPNEIDDEVKKLYHLALR